MAKQEKKVEPNELNPVQFYNINLCTESSATEFIKILNCNQFTMVEGGSLPGTPTKDDLRWLRNTQHEFRLTLNAVLAGEFPPDSIIGVINHYCRDRGFVAVYSAHKAGIGWRLERAPETPWFWRLRHLYLWVVSLVNEEVKVRRCQAISSCTRVFSPQFRGSEQQYCSKKCRNREAARRRRIRATMRCIKECV